MVPGLWKHKTKSIQFVLGVDGFGIKYIKQQDLDHLIKTLQKYYNVIVDMDEKEFVKIELNWDYKNGQVHLSMQPYLQKALHQFDNVILTKRHYSPYPHIEPTYGAQQQFAKYDDFPLVGPEEQKHVQKVNGKFLWCGRTVYSTILTALSALASQQAKPNRNHEKGKTIVGLFCNTRPCHINLPQEQHDTCYS